MLPTWDPWTLQSTEIHKRPAEKFKQDFTGARAAARGRKTRNRYPSLRSKEEGWLFKQDEGRRGSVGRAGGVT